MSFQYDANNFDTGSEISFTKMVAMDRFGITEISFVEPRKLCFEACTSFKVKRKVFLVAKLIQRVSETDVLVVKNLSADALLRTALKMKLTE